MAVATNNMQGFVLASSLVVIGLLAGLITLSTFRVTLQTRSLADHRDALQVRATCYRYSEQNWQGVAASPIQWQQEQPDALEVLVRYRLQNLTSEYSEAEVICEKGQQQMQLFLAILQGGVVGRYVY